MKNEMQNSVHLEGYLYENKLELKTTGSGSKNPGTDYFRGSISVATDNQCLNVIPVYFTYVTEKTKSGTDNATFKLLKDIYEGRIGSIMEHGKENASMLRIDTSLNINDFVNKNDEMVSQVRNEGGFVHITTELSSKEDQRCKFNTDIVITSCTRKEANEERKIPEKVIVHGAIFGYKNALIPVEFSAINPNAMDYFESLGASNTNPVFTRVWGRQICSTVVREIVEESAFGEPTVREVRSSVRDFEITGASPEPYAWDDPSSITAEELKTAMQNREIHLAEVKQRQDEYQNNKNNVFSNMKNDGYNF